MLYKGFFRSILRDNLYRVEIQTGTSSTPAAGELTFGPAPFTTQMERGNTIYSPVKSQSANIQIVNDEYMFSLYASTAKQNSVKLYDASNNLLFTGYTTPNMYDAPYDFETETYSIEALDGLAILKYYDYETIGLLKDFRSFAEIINHLLTKSGCYTKWYWNTATSIVDASGNVPEQMTISEACFFDEDGDPMKMNEVLEEICKFCGVTAVAYKDAVYFIDYDGIRNNKNTYLEYSISSSTSNNSVQLVDTETITKNHYAQTGSNISIEGTYSKVTVKDSLYAVDSIIPDLFNDEDLENVVFTTGRNRRWTYEFSYDNLPPIEDKYFKAKMRGYRNKNFNYYYYDTSTGNISSVPYDQHSFDGYTAHNFIGCCLARFNVASGDSSTEVNLNMKYDDWDDYLFLTGNYKSYNVKVMETKDEFIKPFFVSTDAKIIYKGSLIWNCIDHVDPYQPKWYEWATEWIPGVDWSNPGPHVTTLWPYFPITDLEVKHIDDWLNIPTTVVEIPPKNINLRFGVSIGGYSAIDASTWGVGENNSFLVPFCDRAVLDSTSEEDNLVQSKKKHEIFFKEHNILNNVMYYDNVKEEGFCVSLSGISNETTVIGAKPKLTFYAPVNELSYQQSYVGTVTINPVASCFIKGLEVKAVIPYEGGKDNTKMDVEYTYEINDEYTNELGDITFKICTYDGKQLNYSAVAYPYNGNYKFVDQLYNSGVGITNRSENILCYRIVNQYEEPVKRIKLTLFNDYYPWTILTDTVVDIECIIDSMSIDYRYDMAEIEMVEKK